MFTTKSCVCLLIAGTTNRCLDVQITMVVGHAIQCFFLIGKIDKDITKRQIAPVLLIVRTLEMGFCQPLGRRQITFF